MTKSLSLYEMTSEMLALLEAEGVDGALIEKAFGDIQAKDNKICHFIRDIESAVAAHKAEEERIADRRKAMENKIKQLKSYIQQSMERLEVDELTAGTFLLKLQNNPPSVEVTNESAIPARFFTVIQGKILDRKRVGDAIKNGEVVEGCTLARGKSLRIR